MVKSSQVPCPPSARYELPANINSHIEQFFRKYPAFHFCSSAPVSAQFYRLCDSQGWDRHTKERDVAYRAYGDALSQTFNDTYGTEVDDLRSWQTLCEVIEIKPVPNILEECQDVSTQLEYLFSRTE
jgi:hypothetical protein